MAKSGRRWWVLAVWLFVGGPVGAATLRVGPQEAIRSIWQAASVAKDGDTVEIVAGTYVGDVAVWPQAHLTIRGVGGRPKLLAGGRSAEGKAIWVVRGDDVLVENIAFVGARVPDRNGAGIRHEQGRLTVRNCLFDNNQMGILTANRRSLSLIVENSEFANGVLVTPRLSHLLYAGRIGRLEVRGSYFHHGLVGHLLKSRARFSLVEYSRLTDESGGRASYEMDFPNGGVVVLIGNLVQQSATTENNRMISFGAEGLRYEQNALFLASNTLVDDLPAGGEFLTVWSPERVTVRTVNNLLIGGCSGVACVEGSLWRSARRVWDGHLPWGAETFPENAGNQHVSNAAQHSVLASSDFRPSAVASHDVTVDPGEAFGYSLAPRREYVHPAHSQALPAVLRPAVPGAFQP